MRVSSLTFSAAEIGNGPPPLPDVIHSDPKARGKAKDSVARIAIVDDDPWVRRSLDRLMRSAGFKTECFASAEEFLESAGHFLGCMILDLKLPGMNGLELQRRLADEDIKIPIVFVSAHDDRASKSQALKAGATAFLNKPFGDETLLDAVDSALRPGRS
jgi:FixJ family two-component response regulator